MEASIQQQLFELINKSNKFLLPVPKGAVAAAAADTIGSALAFARFACNIGKEAEVYSASPLAETLLFLPGAGEIKSAAALPETFVITVDTSKTKVDEFSYNPTEDQLKIFLTPVNGRFKAEDVAISTEAAGFDAIACFDTPSLELLGDLYAKNTELFFNTPKINVDNHLSNDNYGTVNAIDVTAVSTSEILFELMQEFSADAIDADVATCLLAGIIGESNSFQSPATTPKSFQRAAELIRLGARQQEITTALFKTRKFSMLKLLGRAMARIKPITDDPGVIFSVLTAQDIEKAGGTDEDLRAAVAELARTVPELKLFFLAAESRSVELYIVAGLNVKLTEVVNHFGGEMLSTSLGYARLENASLASVEQQLSEALNRLKPRLGL